MPRTTNHRHTALFCKICKDSGKSKQDYTSHNIRRRGQVVCPVLLATTCRRCHEKGHMASYCTALPNSKTTRSRRPPQSTVTNNPWLAVQVQVDSSKKKCKAASFVNVAAVTHKFAGLELKELVNSVRRQPSSPKSTRKMTFELPWGKPLENWASDDDD
tara:strand:+ start:962 stop:1438 length:477 start_codon:yes stop_codon:yes gene_type:complete